MATDSIEALQTAFRLLTRAGLNTTQALTRIEEEIPRNPEVGELLEFIRSSKGGFTK
jgi:UDP-N-acetylglucosamine acyltransferase